ncbi:MAG: chloride channel protein [Bacteroidetes bacterium]|nr:chloride channel protein [Bacteroidota bacterium]
MAKTNFIGKFLLWRVKHIKQRQFILFLSFIVGILSGLAAVILKNTIHYTRILLTHGFDVQNENIWYFAFPIFGLFLTVIFVKYIVKDQIGHGVSRILYAISKKNSIIKSHNNFSSIIASTFTIAFGGSVGSEAPIVLTGASLGSSLGRLFHLDYKQVTLLVGCGSAGAIAGIFNAPIAGLVFTLEVLMLDLTMASLIPLLISAVTATMVSFFLMGKDVLLTFDLTHAFIFNNIPYYILLGVFTAFISVYFTRASMFVENKLDKVKNSFRKLIYGGLILGLLIFIFPSLFGEGYDTLKIILSGHGPDILNNSPFYSIKDNYWLFIIFLSLILIFKVIAMAVTNGAGGVGGVFAPSLFMGGLSGYLLALIINKSKYINVPESNFALVGMAGVMAGVMHAPMTSIFLIAEITGGYDLFIPLIITSTISFITINYFEPHSIYTKRLAKRGELITHNKDRAVLTLMKLGKVIETDLKTISPDSTLKDLVNIVSKSKRNIFPVVDEKNILLGIVLLDNIREIMFNPDMYETTYVHELMIMPPTYVSSNEPMDCVMKKFEESRAWNLPVIDDDVYVGFVSKSKIFSAYRRILVYFSDE